MQRQGVAADPLLLSASPSLVATDARHASPRARRLAFRKRLREQFGLHRKDADLLFALGDPEGRGQLRYRNFRQAFNALDHKVPDAPKDAGPGCG